MLGAAGPCTVQEALHGLDTAKIRATVVLLVCAVPVLICIALWSATVIALICAYSVRALTAPSSMWYTKRGLS